MTQDQKSISVQSETGLSNYLLLVYDIPKSARLGNPSGMLWRHGFRINLSCWCIRRERLASVPTAEWLRLGVSVKVLPFHDSSEARILDMAREAIAKECESWCSKLDHATAEVERLCAEVEAGVDGSAVAEEAGGVAYRYLRRAKEFAEAAVQCSMAFDLTGDVAHLIAGMRAVIRAKEEAFYVTVTAARRRAEGQMPLEAAS